MSANINGAVRAKLGSRDARKLRIQGRIPANIQGEHKDAVNFSIEENVFMAARRHHEHLFDIAFEGADTETALVEELHWDTFTGKVLHVEFRRVVRGQKTESEVELTFKGMVKGGVLNHLITHITISSLPTEIPDGIVVNVDGLEVGDGLHASDIVLPKGVELITDGDEPIAVVSAVKEEPEEGEDDEAEGEVAPEAPAKDPEE